MLREKDFPLLDTRVPEGRSPERTYHWRWVETIQTKDLKTHHLAWMQKSQEGSSTTFEAASVAVETLRRRGCRVIPYSTLQ